MNREKANEWLENTFSEYTKEEDRKESIFYLLKKLQDDQDKEISRLLVDINDAENEIFRLNNSNCKDCKYKNNDFDKENEIWEKHSFCSNCRRYYEDKYAN